MILEIISTRGQCADELTDIALRSKAYWGYSEAFMHDCEDELRVTTTKLQATKYDFAVARLGTNIVGFYTLENVTEDTLELEALFVDPDYIGKGAGKALFEHAMQRAESLKAKRVEIQSDPNAEAFYLAMGAKRVGLKPSDSIANRSLPLLSIDIRSI